MPEYAAEIRVAIDTSATLFDPGGTARYIRALTGRSVRIADIELVEVSIATSWPWVRRLPRRELIRVHDLGWIPVGVERAAHRAGAQLLHGPAFRVPARTRLPTVMTIHDDTPWDDPPTASWWTRTSLRRHVARAAGTVSLVLVSNRHVERAVTDVVPELGGRIRVTPFGVDHEVFGPRGRDEVAECVQRLSSAERYVLIVGARGARKNFPAMVEALRRARAEPLTLVVVGRAPKARPQADLPIRFVGNVSDAELACLYSGAQFLFYASLKEGFGFPVLEAMACGCPVLTSHLPALEDLAGGAARLIDPRDVDTMARACAALLQSPEEREQLRRAGLQRAAEFSWDGAIDATAAAWREAAALSGPSSPR